MRILADYAEVNEPAFPYWRVVRADGQVKYNDPTLLQKALETPEEGEPQH